MAADPVVVDHYPVVDGEWGAREGKAIQIILRGGAGWRHETKQGGHGFLSPHL